MAISHRIKLISGLASLWLLLYIGCGYHLSPKLSLPPHIKTIAVPIFQNQTSEPDIEKTLTEAVIERIQGLGQLRITTVHQADAVLYGTLSAYEPRAALAFDELYQVSEYRLKITAQVELREVKTDKLIWGKHKLTAKTEYSVSGDVLGTQDAEKEAQEVAADEFARDLVTMWEGF